MFKKMITLLFMAALLPVYAQQSPENTGKKFVVGESEIQRQLAHFKKKPRHPEEIEGFEIGFRREAAENPISLTFKETTIIMDDGSEPVSFLYRRKRETVEIQKSEGSSTWVVFGYFSKSGKKFYGTMLDGIIFDLSE